MARACVRERCARTGRLPEWQSGVGVFKSGFEIPVHGDREVVAESGARCNDLDGRCHKGELR